MKLKIQKAINKGFRYAYTYNGKYIAPLLTLAAWAILTMLAIFKGFTVVLILNSIFVVISLMVIIWFLLNEEE